MYRGPALQGTAGEIFLLVICSDMMTFYDHLWNGWDKKNLKCDDVCKIMSKLAASGETSRKINYWGCDKLFVSYFVKHCWFCHISVQFSLGKYGHGKLHGRQEC